MCIIRHNFMAIGQANAEIWQFFSKCQLLPSWICFVDVWTTCEEYFVLLMTVENLVGINAVVF